MNARQTDSSKSDARLDSIYDLFDALQETLLRDEFKRMTVNDTLWSLMLITSALSANLGFSVDEVREIFDDAWQMAGGKLGSDDHNENVGPSRGNRRSCGCSLCSAVTEIGDALGISPTLPPDDFLEACKVLRKRARRAPMD